MLLASPGSYRPTRPSVWAAELRSAHPRGTACCVALFVRPGAGRGREGRDAAPASPTGSPTRAAERPPGATNWDPARQLLLLMGMPALDMAPGWQFDSTVSWRWKIRGYAPISPVFCHFSRRMLGFGALHQPLFKIFCEKMSSNVSSRQIDSNHSKAHPPTRGSSSNPSTATVAAPKKSICAPQSSLTKLRL